VADRMTFVHISDTHITPPGEIAYDTDTARNLRAVAQRIREMTLVPAAIIVSGDLSNHGEPDSYRQLVQIVEEEFTPLGAPVLLGLGNHDSRLPFRQIVLGQADASDESIQYYYAETVGDVKIVMLDSLEPGRVHGYLGPEQLAWLDAQLAEGAPGGCLVVLHHPSLPRGVPRPDDYLLRDRVEFGGVIARHDNVLAILCGHSHVPTFGLFAGTLHVAAPATAYQLDPSIRDGGRGLEGAGFNLCTVRDGRLMVNPVALPSAQHELYRHYKTFTAMPSADPRSESAGDASNGTAAATAGASAS
jgi:3',5'-cyclic-AMP phosphodiesterase